jgi:hypothetical protein
MRKFVTGTQIKLWVTLLLMTCCLSPDAGSQTGRESESGVVLISDPKTGDQY